MLLLGKLEVMPRDAAEGLSSVTISKRSDAGYNEVLAFLRELESAGQARRTGTRRTSLSLWRLITDEERIAERAAELDGSCSAAISCTSQVGVDPAVSEQLGPTVAEPLKEVTAGVQAVRMIGMRFNLLG